MSQRLKAYLASGESSTNPPTQTTRLPARTGGSSAIGEQPFTVTVALDKLLASIHSLPVFSPVVARTLQLTDRECISAREIAGVVSCDVRFCARLLRIANSAPYRLPRALATINEAVLLLGTDTFREVVLVASSRDLLHRSLPGYGLSGADLWAHSLACGMAAEIIADATGYSNRAEAFIAGLIHDVGKIVLDEFVQTASPFMLDLMTRQDCAWIDAERTVLGYDHCDIGGRIARSWGLPQHIVQAIALHRKPIVSRQTVPLAGLVHLGEALCSMAGIGIGLEGVGMTLCTQVMSDFKFSEAMADMAVSRLVDKLAASTTLLSPPTGSPTE